MSNNEIYKIKMFSSLLSEEPLISIQGMDVSIKLKGYDNDDNYHECIIKFISVIGYKYELQGFSFIKDTYDKLIEIEESDWKNELRQNNKDKFEYWNPKHYVIYLADNGLYQILASSVEIKEIIED